ncbi:unnamed protein product [Gadus morhua 'NCC']
MVMKKGPMNKFIVPFCPTKLPTCQVSSSDHLSLAVSAQCCRAGYTEEDPLIHVFLIMALWTSGSRQTSTEVRRAAYSGGNIRGIIRAGSGESASCQTCRLRWSAYKDPQRKSEQVDHQRALKGEEAAQEPASCSARAGDLSGQRKQGAEWRAAWHHDDVASGPAYLLQLGRELGAATQGQGR